MYVLCTLSESHEPLSSEARGDIWARTDGNGCVLFLQGEGTQESDHISRGGQAISWRHSHAGTQSPGKKSLSLFPSDTADQRDQPSEKLTTTECRKMIQQIPAIIIM